MSQCRFAFARVGDGSEVRSRSRELRAHASQGWGFKGDDVVDGDSGKASPELIGRTALGCGELSCVVCLAFSKEIRFDYGLYYAIRLSRQQKTFGRLYLGAANIVTAGVVRN